MFSAHWPPGQLQIEQNTFLGDKASHKQTKIISFNRNFV